MFTRRNFNLFSGFIALDVLLPLNSSRAAASASALFARFDQRLATTLASNAALIEQASAQRERAIFEQKFYATHRSVGRPKPSTRHISQRAIDLITAFEVTDEEHYTKKLQTPEWPGGDSGVTIGIGYDVGYVSRAWLAEDWGSFLSSSQIAQLGSACGVTGKDAKALIPSLGSIEIPWTTADNEFLQEVLPRYVADTMDNLPNCDQLSDDSLGALVSLVYNRGASFRKAGDRYTEMRAILGHMINKAFDRIPDEIRSMKRLWQGTGLDGLILRRELEAQLFEAGLARS